MTLEQLERLAQEAIETWGEANTLIPHLPPNEPVIYLGHHEWLQTAYAVRGAQDLILPGRDPGEIRVMGVACVGVRNASYTHCTWRPVS